MERDILADLDHAFIVQLHYGGSLSASLSCCIVVCPLRWVSLSLLVSAVVLLSVHYGGSLSLLVSAVVLLSVHYVAVPYSQQFNYLALDAHTVLYCNFDSLVYTLFLFLSRPRSEGWPHHGRTFSIYPCPLSF